MKKFVTLLAAVATIVGNSGYAQEADDSSNVGNTSVQATEDWGQWIVLGSGVVGLTLLGLVIFGVGSQTPSSHSHS